MSGSVRCKVTCEHEGCNERCTSRHSYGSTFRRHRHRIWGGDFHYWETTDPVPEPVRRATFWASIGRNGAVSAARVVHAWNRDGKALCRPGDRFGDEPSRNRSRAKPKRVHICQGCERILRLRNKKKA